MLRKKSESYDKKNTGSTAQGRNTTVKLPIREGSNQMNTSDDETTYNLPVEISTETPPTVAVKLKKTPNISTQPQSTAETSHFGSKNESIPAPRNIFEDVPENKGGDDEEDYYRDSDRETAALSPVDSSRRLSGKISHPEMRIKNPRETRFKANLLENMWGEHPEENKDMEESTLYDKNEDIDSKHQNEEYYDMDRSNQAYHDETRFPEEDDRSTPVSMEPIQSYTCAKKFTRRIGPEDEAPRDDEEFSREDLLAELRSVARREAMFLQEYPDRIGEVYFQPPISPSKLPQKYLTKTDVNEEQVRKQRRIEKVRPEGALNDAENEEFKSFNDFDEGIFKFDMKEKHFSCPWEGCDKKFPSLSRIKRHYIIHTDIKPFKCLNPGCNRRFSRKDNMLQHYRVHCPYAPQFKESP